MIFPPIPIRRAFNPRYSWLGARVRRPGARILDVGAGPKDGYLAKSYWPGAFVEGISLGPGEGFDRYHQADLNKEDLPRLPSGSFDYVVSSHLIEHLDDGLRIVDQMAHLVRKGGLIYLEWPSEESLHFPIRGVGLNFFDDDTHVRTYPLEDVTGRLRAAGFDILAAGHRRHLGRMLLSPLLTLRAILRARRVLLYDLWDFSGFCLVVRAVRREIPEGVAASAAGPRTL